MAVLTALTFSFANSDQAMADNELVVSNTAESTIISFDEDYTSIILENGYYVCVKEDGSTTIRELSGEEIITVTDTIKTYQISGKYFVYIASNKLKVYDLETKEYKTVAFQDQIDNYGYTLQSLTSYSLDNSALYEFEDGTLYIYFTMKLGNELFYTFANIEDTYLDTTKNIYWNQIIMYILDNEQIETLIYYINGGYVLANCDKDNDGDTDEYLGYVSDLNILDNGMIIYENNNNCFQIIDNNLDVVFGDLQNIEYCCVYDNYIAYFDNTDSKYVLADFDSSTGTAGNVIHEWSISGGTTRYIRILGDDKVFFRDTDKYTVATFDGEVLFNLPANAKLLSAVGTDDRFIVEGTTNSDGYRTYTIYDENGQVITTITENDDINCLYIGRYWDNVYMISGFFNNKITYYLTDKNMNNISGMILPDIASDKIYSTFYSNVQTTRYILIADDPVYGVETGVLSNYSYNIGIYDTVKSEFVGTYKSYYAGDYYLEQDPLTPEIVADPKDAYSKAAESTIFTAESYFSPSAICYDSDTIYIKDSERWYSFNLTTGDKIPVSFLSTEKTDTGYALFYNNANGNKIESGNITLDEPEDDSYRVLYPLSNQLIIKTVNSTSTSISVYDVEGNVIFDGEYAKCSVLSNGCIVVYNTDGKCALIKTTSSAYIKADYDAVDEALASIPEDLSKYSDESINVLTAAKDAVVRDKDIADQDIVDGYADAIISAVNSLTEKTANYNDVNEALASIPEDLSGYTDASIEALTAAKSAVVWDKHISDQAIVDNYADAIVSAVNSLTKKTFTVSASANPLNGGTITGTGTATYGTDVTLVATAKSGYTFSKWLEDGNVVGTDTSLNISNIQANHTYVAVFTENGSDVPDTGDNSNIYLLMIVLAISGMTGVAAYLKKREQA